ncbi:hypothetical protein DFH29DRAFT_982617 [Suillus ampliporus]|nr:hypothetical protein DFH29DRAFT_982617 [Suillus ampliporus]
MSTRRPLRHMIPDLMPSSTAKRIARARGMDPSSAKKASAKEKWDPSRGLRGARFQGSSHVQRRENLNKRPCSQSQPPPGVISFYPAAHPAEPFTENYRLNAAFKQDPHLTVLEITSPEQFKRCRHLLRTSLPTDTDAVRDIIPMSNVFVDTVLEAYNNHCGLILRPDDIRIAILTQFDFFVNGHAEKLRSQFVAHEGKEKLSIHSDVNINTADFALMTCQMTELMHTRVVDPMLRDWIMPEFSTTTDVDRAVYAMSMMAMMKEYFHYVFFLRCGIPRAMLLGEKRDWEAILERLERLKLYGIEIIAWYHLLHPVISRFVAAFDAPSSPENLNFWSNALSATRFAAVNTARAFLVLDGTPYPTINDVHVPCGYAHIEVKLVQSGVEFDTVAVASSVGVQICSNDDSELSRNGIRDSVKPVMGYWYFITEKGD